MLQRVVGLGLVMALCAGAEAAAQTCVGAASFRNGRVRIGALASIGDQQKAIGAGIGLGVPRSVFVGGAVSRVDFDDLDENALAFELEGGYQIDVVNTPNVQLCPIVGYFHQSGPNDVADSNIDFSGTGFSFGASVGAIASHSETFDFVPALGLAYVTSSLKAKGSLFGFPIDTTESADYGIISLFGGLIINRVVSITPAVAIPFAIPDAKPEYRLTIAFSFGGP